MVISRMMESIATQGLEKYTDFIVLNSYDRPNTSNATREMKKICQPSGLNIFFFNIKRKSGRRVKRFMTALKSATE